MMLGSIGSYSINMGIKITVTDPKGLFLENYEGRQGKILDK